MPPVSFVTSSDRAVHQFMLFQIYKTLRGPLGPGIFPLSFSSTPHAFYKLYSWNYVASCGTGNVSVIQRVYHMQLLCYTTAMLLLFYIHVAATFQAQPP